MFLGKVVGTVWSTVKWPQVEGLKLLLIQPCGIAECSSDLVVAADVLGAGVGEEVIVAYGHAGRMAVEPYLGPDDLAGKPVDAAVVAIVDGRSVDDESDELRSASADQERQVRS